MLLWPHRHMVQMGSSTRRLGVLYNLEESDLQTCYCQDAHTTYTADCSSHATAISLDALRQLLHDARPDQHMLYNEVVLRRCWASL